MRGCLECLKPTKEKECCGKKTKTRNQVKKQVEYCEEYSDWKTSNQVADLYRHMQ